MSELAAEAPKTPAVRRRDAALFVLLGGLAFSTSGPVARYGRPADPIVLAFGRLFVAALVLSMLEARALRAAARAVTSKQVGVVALAGTLLAVHFALFLVGLDRTSLPAAISLVSLEPLAVVLTAWALFRIEPSRGEKIGVVLATIGAVVVSRGAGSGDHRLEGDLLVLGAVALYGLYLAAARAMKDAIPAKAYAALVYSAASLVLFAYVLATGRAGGFAALEPHSIAAIVFMGLVPTLVGHTAVQTASRVLSPSIVALASPGETLFGIVVGALLVGAVPSPIELAGAAIIVAGATVAILAKRG